MRITILQIHAVFGHPSPRLAMEAYRATYSHDARRRLVATPPTWEFYEVQP